MPPTTAAATAAKVATAFTCAAVNTVAGGVDADDAEFPAEALGADGHQRRQAVFEGVEK